MRLYSVTNPGGATYRIGPSTSAGVIPDQQNGGARKATNGTVVEVEAVSKGDKPNDRWLLLSRFDPANGKPWQYQGKEVRVYIALYVSGTAYADPLEVEVPSSGKTYQDGREEAKAEAVRAIQALP